MIIINNVVITNKGDYDENYNKHNSIDNTVLLMIMMIMVINNSNNNAHDNCNNNVNHNSNDNDNSDSTFNNKDRGNWGDGEDGRNMLSEKQNRYSLIKKFLVTDSNYL